MHFSALLVALTGAAFASAHTGRAIGNVFKRDIPGLPSACSSRCSAINTIYDACLGNDFTTCQTICDPDVQPKYKDCLQCILDNAPSSVKSQLSGAISQVDDLCNSGLSDSGSTGSSLGGDGAGTLGSGSSASPTDGGLGSPTTSPGASITGPFSGDEPSSSSGTSGGTGNSGSSANSGTGNSGTSGNSGNSNTQKSAAATTSGGASVAAQFPNMIGGVVALLGAGAGAALLF